MATATKPTSSITAAESYDAQHNAVLDSLGNIQLLLEAHNRKQSRDQKNWGFPGDMNQVLAKLQEIEAFLSN